eukprot:3344235-Amphidinium_carterae.1
MACPTKSTPAERALAELETWKCQTRLYHTYMMSSCSGGSISVPIRTEREMSNRFGHGDARPIESPRSIIGGGMGSSTTTRTNRTAGWKHKFQRTRFCSACPKQGSTFL